MQTISKRKQLWNNQTIKSASCTVIFVNPTTMSKSYTLTIAWFQYSILNSFYFVLFLSPLILNKRKSISWSQASQVWDFLGNWYWNWNFWLLMICISEWVLLLFQISRSINSFWIPVLIFYYSSMSVSLFKCIYCFDLFVLILFSSCFVFFHIQFSLPWFPQCSHPC